MRIFKYLLVVIGLLFCSSDLFSAKTGWYKVVVPTDSSIISIDFFNSEFGIVLTTKNEILITLDGGNSFIHKTKFFPNSQDLKIFNVIIVKTNEIYITAINTIYLSSDSCNTWIKINPSYNKMPFTCRYLYVYDNQCFCHNDTAVYRNKSLDALNWTQIEDISFYSDNYYSISKKYFPLSSDLYAILRTLTNKNSNTKSFTVGLKNNGIDDGGFGFEGYYVNDVNMFNTKNIVISTSQGIYNTNGSKNDYETILDHYPNGAQLSNINSEKIYKLNYSNDISILYKNKKIVKCIVDTTVDDFIANCKVINEKVAFILLAREENFTGHITNFFLKTEDGGGVDLTDVEEVIPQNDITQSTQIELYDILGRSIATFQSYDKLKAEIENYPLPHLIKWRDEKGIFHFERLK